VSACEEALRDLRQALERHDVACRLCPYDDAATDETRTAVEVARARLAALTNTDTEEAS